jgi:hypothetical protein
VIEARVKTPRCLVGLGILFALVLVVFLGLVAPWLQRNHMYREAIVTRTDQLERYLGLIDTLPNIQSQLDQLKNTSGLDAYYLAATEPSLAGVALQRRVEGFVSGAGASLTSIQILPAETQGATLYKVAIRARLSASTEALKQVLYDIESSKPLLFVPKLNIRALRNARRLRRGRAWDDQMTVNMDVFGYIRRDAG